MADNVEIVRGIWLAWERRDMRALFEFYDTDVEWDMSHSDVPDLGKFHGHEGIRAFFRKWAFEAFDDYQAEAIEFIEAGDKVIVELRQRGRGKGSGVHVEMPRSWQIYTFQGDKVARVQIFRDRAAALEAARQEDSVEQPAD